MIVPDPPVSRAQAMSVPATTTEVPPALPDSSVSTDDSLTAASAGGAPQPADYDDGIIRYERERNPELKGPPVRSLQDFMSGGEITSPLGIEVREDQRKLKNGGEAEGLLVMDVIAGSPAARAGLHPYHRAVRDALETAAVAGSLFFPPVVLFVPVLDQVHLGESYDLIIGVDGTRVANLLDFEDQLREVQPGEIVYLSIIRNGARVQIPVPIPKTVSSPTF